MKRRSQKGQKIFLGKNKSQRANNIEEEAE
jgi:hypothetical protein